MSDEATGQPHTAHTSDLVPLIYIGDLDLKLSSDGTLSDVSPTMLDIMGIPQPGEMTGHSLARIHQTSAAVR